MKRAKKVVFLLVFCLSFLFPAKAIAQVVINEILPVPAEGEDWVELYNPTDGEIVLRDLALIDQTSSLTVINESTISAHGFLVFEVNSRLNKDGDTIYLKNSQGSTIDEFGYDENPGTGIALGRVPDGGQWGICNQPTKGSSNQCALPTPTPTTAPEPTPTSPPATATPTPKPPTATPKPPTPTVKPTLTSSLSPTATEEGTILGESQSLGLTGTPTEEPAKKESNPFKILPVIFIFLGVAFIGGSFYLYWRTRQVSEFPQS